MRLNAYTPGIGGAAKDWNIETSVDLHPRSDLGIPNSSPVTASKPIYMIHVPYILLPIKQITHPEFLIHTPINSSGCEDKPFFVPSTPAENSIITLLLGVAIRPIRIAASHNGSLANVESLSVTAPKGLHLVQTAPQVDPTRTRVWYWELAWTPTYAQLGKHPICVEAEDSDQ
ncbi:hypothetical protein ScPMuIL_014567 [Solemya velum]